MNKAIPTARLSIVPFASEHLTAGYVAWLNDPVIVRYSEQRHVKHTVTSCCQYWESFQNSPNYFWAVIATSPPLGHIGTMTAYLNNNRTVADIGILIGERSAWGHGFGLEAWQAVCQWLFTSTPARKITAGTMTTNMAMRHLMEKAGMTLAAESRGIIHATLVKI